MMRSRPLLVLGLALGAAPVAAQQAVPADSATFVVLRGADTVATERYVRTAVRLNGTLALRTTKPTSQTFTAVIAPDATLPLIEVTVREAAPSPRERDRILRRGRVIFKDDSVAVDQMTNSGIDTRVFGTTRGAIPYINLSFALVEQAMRHGLAEGRREGTIAFFDLLGARTAAATVTRTGADSVVVKIGDLAMDFRVDAEQRILGGRIASQGVTIARTR